MSDVPLDAPSQCPGTQSDRAGQSSACEGCPNQTACSTGQARLPLREREPETIATIRARLGRVRYRVIILSGKGGVGKSSVSACLARGLSRCLRDRVSSATLFQDDSDEDHLSTQRCNVGLLDLDLCGPSIPCMFGCLDEKVHQSQFGWSPVFVSDRLALMSAGFLLPSLDQAVIWRGPRKNALIRQLLTDVCWTTEPDDALDFLLIDTPPGTSDEHLSAVQYLQAANCVDGAIIVTTPQEVALSDVRKEITFCQKLSLPILGIVENMCEFTCPSCGHSAPVFPPTTGGAATLIPDIPLLGRLPLDPRLARVLDEGGCPFEVATQNAVDDSNETTEAHPLQSLRPSDRIMVAYTELIERLCERLRNQVGVDAETGERGDAAGRA